MNSQWFAEHKDAIEWWIGKPVAVLIIILGAIALRWALVRVIDKITSKAAENSVSGMLRRTKTGAYVRESRTVTSERREQRMATMRSLLRSIVTGLIATIAALMVLSEIGINIAPLIASAGIAGVALGFGAQNLVRDFLSGVFMILEDQYGVGDVVDLGDASGTVESVGLRVTRLRDVNGTVWYVRNGEIIRVGNQSQNWARTVLDIPVAYDANLDQVRVELRGIAHELWESEDFRALILEEPEVWGVERLDRDAVVMRVVLKTAPMQQWLIAREMRERIIERFERAGIEIPNTRSLYARASAEEQDEDAVRR